MAISVPGSPRIGSFNPPRYTSALFLTALVLLLCAAPVLDRFSDGSLVEAVLLTLVLVSAIPAAGGRSGTMLIGSLLALPAVAGKWLHHFRPQEFHQEWYLAAAIVFGMFVVAHHLRFILLSGKVDFQVLCAGISTFLMLGLLWTFAYLVQVGVDPESITMELEEGVRGPLSGFGAVYFSYATLSGSYCPEITLTSNTARMLALLEGMTAMFYVAILIARLVALYSEGSARD